MTVTDRDPTYPFQQLLEADIIHTVDTPPQPLDKEHIAELAYLASGSRAVAVQCLLELRRRYAVQPDATDKYFD